MPRTSALLKRSLIFVHRWIGVALSLLFLLWFASGIVMMYWSFPEVTAEQRLEANYANEKRRTRREHTSDSSDP